MDRICAFPMGSGKWMYFVLAGTLGNPHSLSDGISVFEDIACLDSIFMTSASTYVPLLRLSCISLVRQLSVCCLCRVGAATGACLRLR